MKAYGSKRTYGGCRTKRAYGSKKIHVIVKTKNRKRDRKIVDASHKEI